MMTDQPALVSTSAAVAPAGPVPTITAFASVTTGHLFVGEAAWLRVAAELNRAPTREIAVAAVFRRAVRAFARVLIEQVTEFALRAETLQLLGRIDVAEICTERRDAVAVDLLPAA